MRGYTAVDIADLPDVYPDEFTTLVRSLVAFEPGDAMLAVCVCLWGRGWGWGWGRLTCRCVVVDIAIVVAVVIAMLPAHRPTIGDAATRLSTLRQSLYGSDAIIGRLRHALRGAHERMVRVTGCRVFCVGHALDCAACIDADAWCRRRRA